nr:unnamed protein product [Callosobruchus analis]
MPVITTSSFTIETFNIAQTKWSRWVKRLEVAFRVFNAPDDLKLPYLLHFMRPEACDTLCDKLVPNSSEDRAYNEVVQMMDQFYNPCPLEIAEIFRIQSRKQQEGESVNRIGKLHYTIELDDGRRWKRHIDQIRLIGRETPTEPYLPEHDSTNRTTNTSDIRHEPQNLPDIPTLNTNPNIASFTSPNNTELSETEPLQTPEDEPEQPNIENVPPVMSRRSSRVRKVPMRLDFYMVASNKTGNMSPVSAVNGQFVLAKVYKDDATIRVKSRNEEPPEGDTDSEEEDALSKSSHYSDSEQDMDDMYEELVDVSPEVDNFYVGKDGTTKWGKVKISTE